MTRSLRLVVAEDSAILRDGLVALLTRRGHEVLAAVGDGEALVQAVEQRMDAGTAPQVVVADIRMPPDHTDEGLRAALRVRAAHPDVGILLFSQYIETRYAARLLAGDARGVGYLLKDRVADVGEFVDALVRVADGQTVLDPEVVTQLMAAPRSRDTGLDRLTAREREVLALMAEGRSNTAIAQRLSLSTGGVEKNIAAIFAKLDLAPDAADHRRILAVLRHLGT